ncbi:MAG: ABC transporter permease [Proteocatella sp.]
MKKIYPYILLMPFIFLVIIFALGVGNALIQSLGYIPAFGMNDITLKYYIDVFSNKSLFTSIKLSFFIALISSVIAVVIGVLLCMIIIHSKTLNSKVMNFIKLPIVVPHTIVAFFIILFFSQSGFISRFFYNIGVIDTMENFPMILFSENSIGIILGYLWKEIPFVAYFVIAFMSNISDTLGEAAENLGAGKSKTFFYVTLPLSLPVINKAFLIIFAYSFGAYELPFLLGATLPKALPVQAYIEYMHPDLRHRAYSMALNGIMLVMTLVISGLYYFVSKKIERIDGKHYE